MDLDELRQRNERQRAFDAFAAMPWHARIRILWGFRLLETWWAISAAVREYAFRVLCRGIHLRECFRDLLLVIARRPLYVRCLYYTNTWKPCRRPATWTYVDPTDPDHNPLRMPIICDAHLDVALAPILRRQVGRWFRAPAWEDREDVRRRLVRPAE